MKIKLIALTILFFHFSLIYSQTVTDHPDYIDIGNFRWSKNNLNATQYNNGENIPQAKNFKEWENYCKQKTGCWCYVDFDSTNISIGLIYNWYAFSDSRKIETKGWEIPDTNQIKNLLKPANRSLFKFMNKPNSVKIINEDLEWYLTAKNGYWWYNNLNNQPVNFSLSGNSWGTGYAQIKKHKGQIIYYDGYYIRCYKEIPIIDEQAIKDSLVNEKLKKIEWEYRIAEKNKRIKDSIKQEEARIYQEKEKAYKDSIYTERKLKNWGKNKGIIEINGKKYGTIEIGTKTWTSENLSTSKYRDESEIPQAKTAEEWIKFGKENTGAWCYYNFDPANEGKYGKLYNFYAVADKRGIAPEGWHVSTTGDFAQISMILDTTTNFLQSTDKKLASSRMRSASGWNQSKNGNNQSGLNLIPSGIVTGEGKFSDKGLKCYLWSGNSYGWPEAHYLFADPGEATNWFTVMDYGMAIRLVKD